MNELTQNIFSDQNKNLNFVLKKSSTSISKILFKSLNQEYYRLSYFRSRGVKMTTCLL